MTTAASVNLWGTRIGTVALEDGSPVARFEYDRDFIGSGIELSPVAMPLGGATYSFPALPRETFLGLPGLLADSLPDRFGAQVLASWLDSQGRSRESVNAVERLCYTGARGMGALEYEPAYDAGADRSQKIAVDALARLANDILNERRDLRFNADEQAMRQMIKVGMSAGGARPKAVVAWNERTGEFRSGQADAGAGFTHWLMKFDGERVGGTVTTESLGFTRIEYAYHLMATAAGVEMPECRLYEEAGQCHFLTRRFDRPGESGSKLHMQTLAAIAHFDYNDPGAHSYEQAVRVMRRMRLGQDEVEQFYRRMVFNILAANCDDHVKNTSFLMDRSGAWRLAPAYDVTYAYDPGSRWLKAHQMSANGKLEGFTREDLIAAARHMSIGARKAHRAIDEVRAALADWMLYAESAGVGEREALEVEAALSRL